MRISEASQLNLKDAAQKFVNGCLIAFPTETVYGLGADALNREAVARIYEVKGRPSAHPLIIHISTHKKLDFWAKEMPDYVNHLVRDFWPGPMTLILRCKTTIDHLTGGQQYVGLRVPAHPTALDLLHKFEDLGGHGVAAPSANRFGAVSPTSARAVVEEIGAQLDASRDLVIDGGDSVVGIESTIIDCSGEFPSILRLGAITEEMIQKSADLPILKKARKIRVSGALDKHYSPRTRIFLAGQPSTGDGFLALAEVKTPPGAIRIGAPANVEQYARQLYSLFREADRLNLRALFVVPPTGSGLADAIVDRLKRAAH